MHVKQGSLDNHKLKVASQRRRPKTKIQSETVSLDSANTAPLLLPYPVPFGLFSTSGIGPGWAANTEQY
jgi:hypothetical protein